MAGYHHRRGMSKNAVGAYRRNLKSISRRPRRASTMRRHWHTFTEGQSRRPRRARRYAEPSSTTPALMAHTTICCLVRKPSFFCTPDTALRTVSGLTSLTSPIS